MVHRLIWVMMNGEIPAGLEIDHINGVRSDNRLKNLRMVTDRQNAVNRPRGPKSSSGFRGVSWEKAESVWRAKIVVEGRVFRLGRFKQLRDAIAARRHADRVYGYPSH